MSMVIDAENTFNRYWGVPLATLDDLYSLSYVMDSKIMLWMSSNELEKLSNGESQQIIQLLASNPNVSIVPTRPTNSKMWYQQFYRHFELNSIFHFIDHFPAIKVTRSTRILRIHDPFSLFRNPLREFISRDSCKNKISRATRSFAFKRIVEESILVCNSNFTANRVSDIYNISRELIHVVPNSFMFLPYNELQKFVASNNNYFLIISGLRGNKRPDLIINFWATLSDQFPNLIVVGKVPLECLSPKARIQLSKQRLILRDFVEENELWKLKTNANAMIFASESEGFGRPIVEALSVGVPSIANDIEVFREILPNTVDLFDLNNLETLEVLLVKYCNKITAQKSKELIELSSIYSHQNVSAIWDTVLRVHY